MVVRFPLVMLSAVAALWMGGCGGDVRQGDGDAAPAGQVDVFATRIAPILESSCGCHTGGSAEGGIVLDSYTAAMGQVIKGDALASPLLVSMTLTNGVNAYYSSGDAEAIRTWIDAGAPRYGDADSLPATGDSGYAGISSCANHCHGLVREEWLRGPHGNLEEMDETHQDKGLGLDSLGFPAYGYNGLGEPGSDCSAACHDPQGDGEQLASGITGNVPRPVVGCESCHGAGGDHLAIDYPKPGPERCGLCHNAGFTHNRYHPEGDNIIEAYQASPHAAAGGRNRAKCVKCHNDEGARTYRSVDNAVDLEATEPIAGETHAIQCRTCHDPHDPGKLLKSAVLSDDDQPQVVTSAEYATCTNCHQPADAQLVSLEGKTYAEWKAEMEVLATQDITTDQAQGDLIYHAARFERVISSTHFDNPATSYQSAGLDEDDPNYAENLVEGYVVVGADDRACRGCHNQHAADITINLQWAGSAHGGELLESKEAAEADDHSMAGAVAIRMAGANEDNSWPHYNWDSTTKFDTDGVTVTGDRGACQMCHTATGNKNFQDDPAGYDLSGAGNDFSHLAGWLMDPDTGHVTSSGQNELLYCWSCHADNVGTLRGEGPVTLASYTYAGEPVTLPDVGASNICVNCHAGRGNIDNLVDSSRSSRFEGHHGTAAGSLFSAHTHIAYEYDVDGDPETYDYANKPYFAHDQVGTVDADGNEVRPGTGTAGPCAGCHMAGANHTLRLVTKDAEGAVTAVDNLEFCGACHNTTDPAGSHYFSAEVVEEERLGFEDSIALLGAYVQNTLQNYLDTNIVATYKTVELDAYGAFQNYKYLDDEPGAYAHNRYYAKRLLYDSIDWLDNGALDGSVVNTLNSLDEASSYKAGAVAYLLASDDPATARP